MKNSSFFAFLGLFKRLEKKHFLAALADASFLLLAYLGMLGFTRLQLGLATRAQSLNLIGALASPSAEQTAAVQGFALQLFGMILLFAVYLILCWVLTRALVWKFLVGVPRGVSFFRLWLKLILPNFVWLLITVVPLYFLLFKLALIYENPLVQIVSQPAGYAYIFFVQLSAALLLLLYCHFTNLFYLTYFKTPRFRALWDALVTGVVEFHSFLKPLGILFVFFIVIAAVGMLTNLLPEPFKTIFSFGFLFFFALISRMWYVAVLSRPKH